MYRSLIPLLALLAGFAALVAAQPGSKVDPSRFDATIGAHTLHVVAQVTPSDIRTLLDDLKVTYKEDRDSDSMTCFSMAGGRDPILLNLRKDGGATFVTSVEMTTTFSTKDKLGLSAANDWNSTTRFSRCSIDAEGKPALSTDLIVAEGVTTESLKTTVQLFIMSARKFNTEVLAKRGL